MIFLFILVVSLGAHAQAKKKRVRVKAKISWKLSLDWLNGAFVSEASDSIYNPGNQVLNIPSLGGRTDFILDYKLNWGSRHRLIARSRFLSEAVSIQYENPKMKKQRSFTDVDFIELFAESWLSNQVSLTLGQQNYQWGPAEIIAPSNPIFHFNQGQRSILWREKGHVLARFNWSPTADWSHVIISEPISNQEPNFIAGRKFKPKTIFKSEVRSANSAQNYFGLTGGTEQESRSFVGAYFNYMMTEGTSIYADSRFTDQAFRYKPSEISPANFDMLEAESKKEWTTVSVVGLRLETENIDLRLETINNPMGYSKTQFQQALLSLSLTNPNAQLNAERVLRPGLELTARNYTYLSLRLPNLGREQLLQAAVRFLHSGLDDSGLISLTAERSIGNQFVLISEARQSVGDKEKELTLQEKHYFFLGLKLLL